MTDADCAAFLVIGLMGGLVVAAHAIARCLDSVEVLPYRDAMPSQTPFEASMERLALSARSSVVTLEAQDCAALRSVVLGEVSRLRGLIEAATAEGWCPWCPEARHEGHDDRCPAFTPSGEVR